MKYGLNSITWISPFSNKNLDMIKKVSDMGFDVFEIALEQLELIDCDRVAKAADQAKIRIEWGGAFGPSRDMSAQDDSIRANAIKYLKSSIEYAGRLNSKYVAGPMYAATGDACQRTEEYKNARFKRAANSLRSCAEYAKKFGVSLAIEPLNRFETDMINTVDQGNKLIDEIGMDNVGLLLDTFHMNIEEESITDAIRSAKGRIINFHSCANNRGTPGKDNFNWFAIKQALKDVNYDGNLVIESFTPDCVEIAKAASIWRKLAESPEILAREGLAFLKSVFD